MNESDGGTLGQGLIFEDFLPLKWRALAESPALAEVSRLNESNEEMMRFIDVLDEYPGEPGEEHAPLRQELARVEAKVNLLLGLVGQLVVAHFPLPPARAVKLNPMGIEWVADEGLQPGGYGLVDIYPNARCPRPLSLPGRLERVEVTSDGFLVAVRFEALSETLQGNLEKMIFRHHRRQVALARRLTSPETDTPS